jgi:VIT1/CCC1 family predicted Fe2+/Mn2+ transporter
MSIRESWFEETQAAWLYRHLTVCERDLEKKQLFAALADAAESQARVWAKQAAGVGEVLPESFRPTLRARVVAELAKRLGPRAIRPVLAAMKVRGVSVYQSLPLRLGHVMPTSVKQVGGRHRGASAGSNLRAAVFGVNDGLVSTTSLVMGVAGAAPQPRIILLTGIAGLLAGAFSMAAGEYVSMRSQRELFEYQIALERDELEQYPEEEAEELALVYNARGLDINQARTMAQDMLKEPQHALDVLAREELGLNPEELGSPWGAAWSSFAAFAAGGSIPLIPFVFGPQAAAIPVAAALAVIALFVVGAALSLFTGRNAAASGMRMVLIGGGAASVTYTIGALLGVSLS